ncbi:MAG: flippase-like domain-containing protein [Candidatus Omnitrophica bacterium]|nr:flippase-like domain-containing protein [Candidatus Omnitrophota bacterium]
MKKKWVFNILRILVSLGLIVFLFWLMRESLGEVALVIKKADKLILFASFLFTIFGIILLGVRLKVIMKAQHLKVNLKEAVSFTFIGQFFSNFLPTTTGGDIVKAYYVSKKTGKTIHSIACIIMDRLLGTFTLVVMMLMASFLVKEIFLTKPIKIFLIAMLIMSFVVILVLFSKKTAKKVPAITSILKRFNAEEKMKGLYEVVYNYKKQPVMLLNAIFLSIFLQSAMFYSVYLIMRSLNFSTSLKLVFLWMPIISTLSMAPSINGLGIREGSFVFFFGGLMGKEGAFALSLLWLALNFAVSLIGGILYVFGNQYQIGKVMKGA